MNTLNYHIEYDQSEKGHQWLGIAEHFFVVYILGIQVKKYYLQSLDHNENNDHKLYVLSLNEHSNY
jgi:hypothetical protein